VVFARPVPAEIAMKTVLFPNRAPQPVFTAANQSTTAGRKTAGFEPSSGSLSAKIGALSAGHAPRVALLTPYTGGNFGDAAIQDALIANLRLRLPGVQFSGISLNCDNFLERHGTDAFPLCSSNSPFYGMAYPGNPSRRLKNEGGGQPGSAGGLASRVKAVVRLVPGARWLARQLQTLFAGPRRELFHCVAGYHFLRGHDLVVVCGGGQLDEEWGGPWGHPFALFKWAALSKFAGVPYVVASVGACKVASKTSRFFLSAALRMSRYRSYREKNSREIAAGFFSRAANDSVVPDLAFSLPSAEIPPATDIQAKVQGRTIVAISPIAYAKPGFWPSADQDLYDRYLEQMTAVVSELLRRGYFLVWVWSARSDEPVISEIRTRLDEDSKSLLAEQAYFPTLTSWRDLVAVLEGADFLIASRLHSTIFGFLAEKPLVALSFDPKVDWVMRDLGQSDSLLQIPSFTACEVLEALAQLELGKKEIVRHIASYRLKSLQMSDEQYDRLAQLATGASKRPGEARRAAN
jgi:polysaccharide pyruvyl transferase WcaK-like protein